MIKINISIKIVSYKEDILYFVYAPELDLTGYGKTLQSAHDSFKIVINEYFRYTITHNTLITDLKKLGWNVEDNKITPPERKNINAKLKEIPELNNQMEQMYQIPIS